MQNGDDDFDLTKYVLKLSKKIAQLTKDYVGLPFSTASQLPFAIEARPRAKLHTITKKWQKGDPLIGMQTQSDSYKKMILNLPDGTTLLDMCYPGWEISIMDEPSLEHFFRKRYMFGDYYAHFLNGRPLQDYSAFGREAQAQDGVKLAEEAKMRREEIMKRRRTSLEQAAQQQQARGVPFDAPPFMLQEYARQSSSLGTLNSSSQTEASSESTERKLVKMSVSSRHDTDLETGLSDIRLAIKKTYSNGETETVHRRSQNPVTGQVDGNLDSLLSSQHLSAFPELSRTQDDKRADQNEDGKL